MAGKDILTTLRQFDAYPKTLDDFRIKTFGGATVTVISSVIMFILFISELNYYLTNDIQQELFVDTSRGQKLKINIDITFHKVGCTYLSVDAMDVSGEQHIDVEHNVYKQRLNASGEVIPLAPEKENVGDKSAAVEQGLMTTLDPNRCESCYGAESAAFKCCNTCDDVKEAYRQKGWAFRAPEEIAQCHRDGYVSQMNEQKHEGCRVFGYLEVNKVAGNFHIAPGRSYSQQHVHVHDMQGYGGHKFNLTHRFSHLSFGVDYPGQLNPLDGVEQIADKESTMFQYFVKIVPTAYIKIDGQTLFTNQFSVTKHQKYISGGLFGEQGLPGVFVTYELSPMMVKYTEKQRSFMHFLTGVCAIVGGVFTVAGLVDAFVYHSSRAIQRKIQLGKTS
jgi:predicted small secreted protein